MQQELTGHFIFVLGGIHFCVESCPLSTLKIHCESCPRLKRLKLKTLTSSSQNWTPLKELPEITNEWTILYIFSTWLTCNKNQIPRNTLWCIIFSCCILWSTISEFLLPNPFCPVVVTKGTPPWNLGWPRWELLIPLTWLEGQLWRQSLLSSCRVHSSA